MTAIDASALVAFVLREEGWEVAEDVLRSAPSSLELLPLEAANAILTARKRKRLTPAESNDALRTVHRICERGVTLHPPTPLLPEAWQIAEKHGLTVYDAVYLALARRESVPLASGDTAQIRAARELSLRVIEV